MHHRKHRLPVFLALLIALVALAGCGTRVPPTVTLNPLLPLDPDAPIYVTANRERARVVLAVQNVGLNVATAISDARYSLRVKIGRSLSRGGDGSCGGNANVAFILDAFGRRAMVIKGRGRTQQCEPNILDEMSAKLEMGFGL